MCQQLSVHVNVVIAGRHPKSRDIDRDVEYAEKGQCEHSRYRLNQGLPVHSPKI